MPAAAVGAACVLEVQGGVVLQQGMPGTRREAWVCVAGGGLRAELTYVVADGGLEGWAQVTVCASAG